MENDTESKNLPKELRRIFESLKGKDESVAPKNLAELFNLPNELESILEFVETKRMKKLKSGLLLVCNSAKERIFQVADHVAKGIIQPDETVEFSDGANQPSLPEQEVWDFKLGDSVKIGVSKQDFKWTQKKTIGWRSSLYEVYGQVGVVTLVHSKYENSVGVFFPEVYTACSLYAGVLGKVSPEKSQFPSRWKPGDFVKTVTSDKVLRMLSRGLDQLPANLIGARGRIVAITYQCVIVTFDEMKTYFLKSSVLVPCEDKTPLLATPIEHPRNFQIGDKVKVISNLRKLIENQKDSGGWKEDMSPIRGKLATVINVCDGILNIQTKNSRLWRINSDSVLSQNINGLFPSDEEPSGKDLDILPQDIVKINAGPKASAILAMEEVPSVFLEFLRMPAKVTLVDDDLHYYVSFNNDQNIEIYPDILCKVTDSEKETYENIEKRVQGLKKRDAVCLDIGPPNLVQVVIAELKVDPKVQMALTNQARIIGFVNPYIAVIEYDNGLKCCVKKKFLTVPEKSFMAETKKTIRPETVICIRNLIERSVEDIHSRDGAPTEEWEVSVISMFHGNPPSVEFKIKSTRATYVKMLNWMKENFDRQIESFGNQFVIRIDDKNVEVQRGVEVGVKLAVKVGIIFNDEFSEFFRDLATSKTIERRHFDQEARQERNFSDYINPEHNETYTRKYKEGKGIAN